MTHNLLLKMNWEVWKSYPHGRPHELCPVHLLHCQKLAEAVRRVREDAEKSKTALDNSFMQLYLEDVKANLARDPDF